jgi:1-acyl-sn-glycerol-3-phosphate acyltransferase
MRRVAEWILTVPFLLLFGLTLVLFDIAGRIARPFGLRPFEAVMASLQRTLLWVFGVLGTRVEVERHPAIQPHMGYAVVSNHQSLFDIVMIGGLLFSNYPKYVAKAELGKWLPSISLNLKRGGNALIDRKDRMQSVRAISRMAKDAQDRNVSVVIFPEGTRSEGSQLGEFRRAGTEALLRAADRLPVLPTAIEGSWRLNRMFPAPIGTRVRIRFGEPLTRVKGDAGAMIDRARTFIEGSLTDWTQSQIG